MPEDFRDYLARRFQASDAFVAGEIQPLLEVSTTTAPASIFGPSGTVVEGAEEVNATNTAGAALFTGADRNDLAESHSGSEGDLAYWTGVQRSVLHMQGQDDAVPMDLRVTELYRREDGAWKLFHRHADVLKG